MPNNAVLIESITKEELFSFIEESVKKIISAKRDDDDQWLTPKMAASYLHISTVTLHKWKGEGKIIAEKFGKNIRYRKSEIDKISKQHGK